jgi:hypothetical protein
VGLNSLKSHNLTNVYPNNNKNNNNNNNNNKNNNKVKSKPLELRSRVKIIIYFFETGFPERLRDATDKTNSDGSESKQSNNQNKKCIEIEEAEFCQNLRLKFLRN